MLPVVQQNGFQNFLSTTKLESDGKTEWQYFPFQGQNSLTLEILKQLRFVSIEGFYRVIGKDGCYISKAEAPKPKIAELLDKNKQLLISYSNQLGLESPRWFVALGTKNSKRNVDLTFSLSTVNIKENGEGSKVRTLSNVLSENSPGIVAFGIVFGGGHHQFADIRASVSGYLNGPEISVSESIAQFKAFNHQYEFSSRLLDESEKKMITARFGSVMLNPMTCIEIIRKPESPVLHLNKVLKDLSKLRSFEFVNAKGDLEILKFDAKIAPYVRYPRPAILPVRDPANELKMKYYSNLNLSNLKGIRVTTAVSGVATLKNVRLPI